MHGAIGILWEQAGVRGLVIDRSDETKLNYHDGVRHHYISGLATIEVAAKHRQELLGDFYQARADAVRLGREGPVRDFFLLEGPTPYRAARLASLLVQNGIEVRRVRSPVRAKMTSTSDSEAAERTVPAGSYHVPVAQPAGRLVRILLDRHTGMGEEFIKRQLDRLSRRLSDEIYDVTAWSLPLAFGLVCHGTGAATEIDSEPWQAPAGGEVRGAPAKLAYIVPGSDDGAMLALAEWLQAGLRVHVTDQPLKLGGVDFGKGSLILKVHENSDSLQDAVEQAAGKYQLTIHATDTGYVSQGAHLGGPEVKWVKPPRVAMLVDRPASYSVGHTWYLFDQVWRYPVTRVAGRNLAALDLAKYNVLILPDGGYSDGDTPSAELVGRIKEWVRRGGTLIVVKAAAAWACGEKVGLLASKVEKKPAKPAGDMTPIPTVIGVAAGVMPLPTPASSEKPADEPPDPVPGAFLHASVYDDHWVTFGAGATADVFMNGSLILAPLKPTAGRNLVTFATSDQFVASGFCWPETVKQLAGKPYVLYQSLGDGHIIGFAEDPNFRAMHPGVQRLFLNAVFLGPGH
jgi:hypothetical protein